MNEGIYAITPADLTAANRLHFRKSVSPRKWLFTFLLSAASLALLLPLYSDGFDGQIYAFSLGGVWLFITTICLVGWIMIPRQALRTWNQSRLLQTEQHLQWDPEKLRFRSERGEVHVSWKDYHRWAADHTSLLLYQDDRAFYLLPLRCLPAGAGDTIIKYLCAAGVKER
jgi:hypothetical protein